ncbi:hypothetical protein M8C21_011568, partial [Ambrosia artemisiifolia]
CKENKEMALQNGELSKDELLDSQAHIWNHIFSFINSMSLKCAIQLQIPDIIHRHGSPMLLSELVEALNINHERTPFVYRLMRILVHSGFFVKRSVGGNEKGGEGYSLAPASRLLLKNEPLSVRPFLLAMLDPILVDPWQDMSKWFQTDEVNPFQTTHGKLFWDLAGEEVKLNHFFNEGMASDARLVTSVILKHYDNVFEGLDSIVDVGGGTGTVAQAIAKAFPNIRCISFDLPHVVDGLVGSKNLSFVGGDMFEVIPKANALLLKTQLFYDMLMMTLTTGRERNEEDWAKLFLDAGFSDYKITPILGLRSLIELSEELLDSQAHIWNHIFSSISLKCAVQLQIPDIIAMVHQCCLSELVEALGINQERTTFVYWLMHVLVHSGFFVKQIEEPLSISLFLLAMLDSWQYLSKWFQNDDAIAVCPTHGRMLSTRAIREAIAKAFSNIVNRLVGYNNLSYVGGDRFEAISKADALLIEILKQCKDASSRKENGGELIIKDMVVKMALQNGELSTQLLDSQAHIWNHIFSFINSMSLKCAVQLQIPDIIHRHGSPMLLSELVEALGIKQERTPFVYRLMRILVHSGFFVKQSVSTTFEGNDEEGGEGYLLTHASRLLLKEEPLSLRPFLLAMLDPLLMDPWQNLSKWFQNDDATAVHTTHGRMIWDLAGQEQNFNNFFNEAMASDARLVTTIVLEHCRGVFEGLASIVDVGGGTGTVAKAIAKAFPNIMCTSFDLPHVVGGLAGSKNMSYVGGDMFEAIPKADAVLLKWILHDWNDEKCIKILKQCKEAIPSKENRGKLIIIDMVVMVDEGENDLLKTH